MIGGASGLDIPTNLESVLIELFAEPAVAGIYLDGVWPGAARDPAAALLDGSGRPTGSGAVVDRLFRERWWTDEAFESDVLGYVEARVFKGRHRVSATLPSGRVVSAVVEVGDASADGGVAGEGMMLVPAVVLEPVWEESGGAVLGGVTAKD